ncbi:hypothetical protein BDY19DRAFT_724568 [Irpex rosettiformis]|uniref:Uncharacterized protein n=1 Tax=Irpex rosettiformis TaxID=378272 RepID=A0ACB8U8C8_9APHY|nr:hypothetical protein BDY19DRAFT_724568 [Irpex rosettiformis]
MTITIRIQYKGEAARKLATEEGNEAPTDPPRYMEQMERALSHFSIPPPHNSRAIWKSGFVLCNWNITRESSLYDIIFRGATRAQSIACKGTLENLSISFIHLFENNKPIWLNYKGRNNSTNSLTAESSTDTLADQSVSFERKKYSSYNHKYGPRSADEPSFSSDSLLSRTSTAATIPTSDSFVRSGSRRSSFQGGTDTTPYAERFYTASEAVRPVSPGTAPDTEDTLRRLAGSQTLLALLGQAPVNNDTLPVVKNEVLSPTPLHARPPSAPRVMHRSHSKGHSINDSAFPTRTLSNLDRSLTKPAPFQDNSDRTPQIWTSRDDRSYSRFNRYDRYDTRGPFAGATQKVPQQRRSASPISRGLSSNAGGDISVKRFRPDREGPERGFNDLPFTREQEPEQTGNTFKRHTYNGDKAAMNESSWSTGLKRPLSPATARYDQTSAPHTKRFHPVSSVAAEAAAARRPYVYKRQYNPAAMARRSASPMSSQSWVSNSRPAVHEQPGTKSPEPIAPAAAVETSNGSAPGQERINTLNRELWDVRRQLTALKAREDCISKELQVLRAPVSADPAGMPGTNGLTPEERVKTMELEMNCTLLTLDGFLPSHLGTDKHGLAWIVNLLDFSHCVALRERLEREKERRLLVEEACENERKRRKLAEDILDDTRRETNKPIMLPAMMDAFEKIAQLTGDALNKDEE